ncbi:AAA family ATPase [Roseicella aquatilis]|uniref:AAA family ATPase n=1 Tax=Roseicella aquatilis TaxID=2527868 RepID=UPI0014054CD4|nr:ATP-binding protein [Roseicella aquatilis]
MPSSPPLRFTRVKLVNWRNFRDAEVRFSARAFVVGPNASGKSNLLDALRFLRDLAKPVGGGLAAAVEERGGFTAIRCLEARRPSHVEFDVDVGTDDDPALWNYQLRLQRYRGDRMATVESEVVRHGGSVVSEHVRPKETLDTLAFSQTKLEQVAQNGTFRELQQFFGSIRYLHVVPQIVRDARRHVIAPDDPHGGDLLRRIKEMPAKARAPRLRRVAQALKVAVPQFLDLTLEDDAEGRPHLYASYDQWRRTAARQSEEMFSDGTLRLIGFLWSITEKGGPLLLEEPELSLHDAVVQLLPAMIRRAQRFSGRQVIATTHSYAILAAPGVALEDVHRVDVTPNGSVIETASANDRVVEQVTEGGWTIADAVLPLTKPRNVQDLATLDVVTR